MALENWSIDQVESQLDSGRTWTGDTISFAFPAFSGGMTGTATEGELAGFRATTAAQQTLIRLAMQTWDDLIAPDFALASSNSNLEFGFSSTMSGFAHAYFPSVGSVWFSAAYTSGENNLATPGVGDYGFVTYIHEIGHALGLNHMGNYNGSGSWNPSSFQDSTVLSVMSYFGPSGPYRSTENAQADWINAAGQGRSPQTPMLNDVYVIQRMYGASTTTRTGDTVYGFGSNVTGTLAAIYDFTRNADPILTLFDSGGNDTLNLSGWSTPSDIRLEAGSYSSVNAMTNNIAIAYGVIIENAAGGSGNDRLTGNAVGNRLEGGGGNDQLIGADGDDTLAGGAGNDTCEGGAGIDTALLSASYAACVVSYDAGRGEFRISASASGTDLFYGVERFQFSDQLLSVDQLLSGDSTAPTLETSSPADNATGVSTTVTLRLTFSETVEAGSGEIRLFRSDGQLIESIPVGDAARVTIDGRTVTINPDTVLSAGTGYFLNVAAGVLQDGAGNAWAGISGNTGFNFNTSGTSADTIAPTLLARTPADDATGVPTDALIVLTFSETVAAGTGAITIRAADGTVLESISVTDATRVRIDGDTVTIDPSANFAPGTGYSLSIASGALRDRAGNAFAGISGNTAWNFSTEGTAGDTTAPTLSARSPVDGSVGVAVSAVFTLTFSEAMRAGTGDIQIRAADGSLVQSIPVSDAGQVQIDNNVVTIDPAFDLAAGGDFFIAIPAGTLRDLAGNPFAGFTSSSAWNFSTAAASGGGDDFPWDTGTPGIVTVGGQATAGRIEVVDDLDLFRVELQAGVTYRLDVNGTGVDALSDPYLVLYDPDVALVGQDDDSGGGLDASLTYTPGVSGTYYVGAYDAGSDTGDYTVSAVVVDQSIDDFPDSTATTGEVITDGTPLLGRIDYDGDFDVVAVFLQAGITYRLDVRQSGNAAISDPTLWLYDVDANFIVEDYNSGGGDVDASLTYTAVVSGYHYIGIDDAPGSTGTYAVSAVQVSDAIDDLPYGSGVVGDIAVDGGAASGRIDYADDIDVFAVELQAGTTYRFDMTRVPLDSISDPFLQIYDASEVFLAQDDDSGGGYNASLTFTPSETGTYLVAAFDYSTDTGSYSLRAVTVDATPPELIDATPGDGETGVRIDAPIVLRFSEDVQRGTGDILLYNGNGSLARAIDVSDASAVQFSGGVITIDPGAALTPGADYYVIIDPGVIIDRGGNEFAGIGDPGVLNFSTAAVAGNDDFPLDPATTGVVTVNGAAVGGVIDYIDDGDLFRIEMVRGKTYIIDLARTSGGLQDPYLALYSPAGDFVTFDDDGGSAGNSRIRFTALESGTFFLGVFDYSTGTGGYTLRATTGPADLLVGGPGNDLLRGLAGNDTLDGAGGVDTLEGGSGNDIIVVDDSRDVVRELASGGIDTVQSTASYTLPANVERLVLTGDQAVNGAGNAAANRIAGNVAANQISGQGGGDNISGGAGNDQLSGNAGIDSLFGDAGNDTLLGGDGGDRLSGGTGRDQLRGGSGADHFLFADALSASGNVDTVQDFARAQGDKLQLDDDIFRALSAFTGASLPAGQYQSLAGVDEAQSATVRIIYNSSTGALYYDPDGNGTQAAVQFALLSGAPVLTASDILIVG